jgi:hypothetical protein
LCRRRPSEEAENKKELNTSGQPCSREPCDDSDCAWQRLRNGWLNDQVGGVAKRTVGLNCLPVCVRVRVHGLHDPTESNECTAEKAEHYPQQVACS